MTPQLQYLQMLAQRLGNTPAGQWVSSQAQRAFNAAGNAETKFPTLSRGPGGQWPARPFLGDRTAVQPFSRGAAGLAGAGAVGAGSGQFEGVRDRQQVSQDDARSLMDDIMVRYQQRQENMQGKYPSEREMRRFAPTIRAELAPPSSGVPIPGGLFDVLSSYGAGAPMSQQPMPVRQMDSTLFGEDVGPRPVPMRVMDSTLAGYDMPTTASLPPRRPTAPGAPMQLASATPSVRESFMQRLLSGPNYQSNSMPVVMSPQGPMPSGASIPQQVNWGDAENAADFFRAEQAARQLGLLG